MEVLYHGIKTRYAYDFPLCFPHELLMSLRNIYTMIGIERIALKVHVAQWLEHLIDHQKVTLK